MADTNSKIITSSSSSPVSSTDDNSIAVQGSQSNFYRVQIAYVEGVSPGNFSQATKTQQALEAAGLEEAGELVLWGLQIGHGHEIKQMETTQKFEDNKDLLGGSMTSEESLVSYRHTQAEPKLLAHSQTDKPNDLVSLEQCLSLKQDVGSDRFIKMTAVMKIKSGIPLQSGQEKNQDEDTV